MSKCKCCDEAKCTKKTGNIEEEEVNAKQPGERFQMDFGFIKGEKDELKILESYDGYSAYLIILDKKTRYMWIFLCKNKIPPTKTVEKFLKKHGITEDLANKEGLKLTIRTDRGGELYGSLAFKTMAAKLRYSIELTVAGS